MLRRLRSHKRAASAILSGMVGLRALLALFLLYTIPKGLTLRSLGIFALAVTTDALDGFLGRNLRVPIILGPYADPISDFILVLVSCAALAVIGLYPFWSVLLVIAMFGQFILTSRLERPLYDPIGKYYGVLLFGAIGITLVFPVRAVANAVLVAMVGFSAMTVISRSVFLFRMWKDRQHRSAIRGELEVMGIGEVPQVPRMGILINRD